METAYNYLYFRRTYSVPYSGKLWQLGFKFGDLVNFGQNANIKAHCVNGSRAISPKLKLAKCIFFVDLPNLPAIIMVLWVAVADPYVGLARKRPKTKWRPQWAENELITYIFAVQVVCSILAT